MLLFVSVNAGFAVMKVAMGCRLGLLGIVACSVDANRVWALDAPNRSNSRVPYTRAFSAVVRPGTSPGSWPALNDAIQRVRHPALLRNAADDRVDQRNGREVAMVFQPRSALSGYTEATIG